MIELTDKRTQRSKTFDLENGGQRQLKVNLSAPMHYLNGSTGKLEDIDLSSTIESATSSLISKAPYILRIDPTTSSYRYTSQAGEVQVTLTAIGGIAVSGSAVQEGTAYRWASIARSTDYLIVPLPFGVRTEMILARSNAPKSWSWTIIGSTGLLLPIWGRDASGQICEITTSVSGDVLTATWSGRVTTAEKLRRNPATAWSTNVVYPVTIDPTINETIVAGADDVHSLAPLSNLNATATYVAAGAATAVASVVAGFRFQTIALPAGATISSATLTVNVTAITGTPLSRFYGDNVDSAAAFATTSRPKNITKTTASVNFDPASTGSKPINVTSIVAEIAGRAGWASNNNMRLCDFNRGAATGNWFKMEALEATGTAQATLDIVYTTGGASWFKRQITFTGGYDKMTGGFDG